jgi:uncharacterized membrane protein
MFPELSILLGWALFAGTHLAGSSRPLRGPLVRALSLPGFKGLYSAVALATFALPCVSYAANKHAGTLLFAPPTFMRHVTEALMLLALVVLGQALASPGPAQTLAELSGRRDGEPRGIQRLTRHPQALAFSLFALAHCLSNPFTTDWTFFGGFIVLSIAGSAHQNSRLRGEPAGQARSYLERTSAWPLAAILAGRQSLALREYRPLALAASVAVFAALRLAHPWIFGGFGD